MREAQYRAIVAEQEALRRKLEEEDALRWWVMNGIRARLLMTGLLRYERACTAGVAVAPCVALLSSLHPIIIQFAAQQHHYTITRAGCLLRRRQSGDESRRRGDGA